MSVSLYHTGCLVFNDNPAWLCCMQPRVAPGCHHSTPKHHSGRFIRKKFDCCEQGCGADGCRDGVHPLHQLQPIEECSRGSFKNDASSSAARKTSTPTPRPRPKWGNTRPKPPAQQVEMRLPSLTAHVKSPPTPGSPRHHSLSIFPNHGGFGRPGAGIRLRAACV